MKTWSSGRHPIYQEGRQKRENQRETKTNEQYKFYKQVEEINNILRKVDLNLLGSLKNEGGIYTNINDETSAVFLDTYFPSYQITSDFEWHDKKYSTQTIQEWEAAKSAGLDKIYLALLQWHPEEVNKHLITIYRACTAYKYI